MIGDICWFVVCFDYENAKQLTVGPWQHRIDAEELKAKLKKLGVWDEIILMEGKAEI